MMRRVLPRAASLPRVWARLVSPLRRERLRLSVEALEGRQLMSGTVQTGALNPALSCLVSPPGPVSAGALMPFTSPGAPTHTVIVTQPSNIVAGSPIVIVVEALDAAGQVVPVFGTFTVGQVHHYPGGSLTGKATVSETNGLITLTGFTITKPGTGNTLSVTVPGLSPVITAAFSVLAAPTPGTLVWTGAGDGTYWVDARNWSPTRKPINGDTLVFPANAKTRTPIDDDRTYNVTSLNSIVFTGSGYTLGSFGGYPTLAVTGGILDQAKGGTNASYLTLGVTKGAHLISVAAGTQLDLNADIIGPGSVTIRAAGVLYATTANAIDCTGGSTLQTGTLEISGDEALGFGPFTMDSGTKLEMAGGFSAVNSGGQYCHVVLNGNITIIGSMEFYGPATTLVGTVNLKEEGNMSFYSGLSGAGHLKVTGLPAAVLPPYTYDVVTLPKRYAKSSYVTIDPKTVREAFE